MATNNTAIIGTLTIVTNAPRSTATPPSSSVSIVNHATKCGLETPIAWRMATNAPGPLDSLANPCCINP